VFCAAVLFFGVDQGGGVMPNIMSGSMLHLTSNRRESYAVIISWWFAVCHKTGNYIKLYINCIYCIYPYAQNVKMSACTP